MSYHCPPDVIEHLKSLDTMIGLQDAKDVVIDQMKAIIIEPEMFKSGKYLLHTVISGPPGVGKTEVGKILAKIWRSLGLVKNSQPKKKSECVMYDILLDLHENHMKMINTNLQQLKRLTIKQHRKHRKKFKSLQSKNPDIQTTLDKLISDTKSPPVVVEPLTEKDFKIVTRVDFVAEYVGQTAVKTRKLLNEHRGSVLFIDEAYALINSTSDSYGIEALTELNSFMSEHPGEIIVIFAGYKDMMDSTIFTAQPGLRSRCNWVFDLNSYTGSELSEIFTTQINQANILLEPSIDLPAFFTKNLTSFPSFGRDTSRLVYQCLLEVNRQIFDGTQTTKILNSLDQPFQHFQRHQIKTDGSNIPPEMMYL